MLRWLLALAACIPCACSGAGGPGFGSVEEDVVHLGVLRSAFENKEGFPSTMSVVNCPQAFNANDPGHWNCVSPFNNSSSPGDEPNHNPGVDSFNNGELCVAAGGGWEWFYPAESSPVPGHGAVTKVDEIIVSFEMWAFSWPPGFTGDQVQTCIWHNGAQTCIPVAISSNTPQQPLQATATYALDPWTGGPFAQNVAFGDVTLDKDVVIGIGHGPINHGLCFGKVWAQVDYTATF